MWIIELKLHYYLIFKSVFCTIAQNMHMTMLTLYDTETSFLCLSVSYK